MSEMNTVPQPDTVDTSYDESLPPPLPDVDPVPDTKPVEETLSEASAPTATPLTDEKPEPSTDDVEEPAPNATLDFAIFREGEKGSPDLVSFPASSEEVLSKRIESLPNIDMTEGRQQQQWVLSMRDSLSKFMVGNVYGERMSEPQANFRQYFEFNGNKFMGRMPRIDQSSGMKTVEGETALIQLLSHMGTGGVFHTPLMNSGIWVAFKPAGEDELIELNRVIAVDKVRLGRETYGLAFSNSLCYTVDRIFDVALRHVYYTTVRKEELPLDKLRDYIKTQDIFAFIWGFLCANYPNGFHYETACVANPSKCNHIVKGNCDLSKMLHIDNSFLTEWQKSHMATMKANSRTLEQVKQYQDQMTRAAGHRFLINEGTEHEIAIALRSPTVSEYIVQGQTWVSRIVDSVHRSLGDSSSLDDRNYQQSQMAKAATLCEYLHWVSCIEFGALTPKDGVEEGYQRKVDDQATIEKMLKSLSANDAVRDKIIEEVINYINRSTVAVVGYETFTCPACQGDNAATHSYPRHVNIIPIDLIQVFFALLGQRLSRIAAR